MKKALSIFLALVMILGSFACLNLSTFAASGTVYYVDSDNGDDSNDGKSETTAWKNLSEHSSFEFNPGDKILLKAGGVYTGRFQPVVSGTKESPITISSYGEAESKPLLITADKSPAILFYNVGGWDVSGLEFTSLHGSGIMIQATNIKECLLDFKYEEEPENIGEKIDKEVKSFSQKVKDFFVDTFDKIKDFYLTVRNILGYRPATKPPKQMYIISDFNITNCVFHDIAFKDLDVSGSCTPIYIRSSGEGARVDNVYISDVNIYNCAYGIKTQGSGTTDPYFVSAKETYNNNITIENATFNNINYGAIVFGSTENGLARNCTILNTCLYLEGYTAPVWFHNCDHVVVENSEVAGAYNWKDGMTVDFDGHTQNSTYQYVYSHDNVCFMKNNNFDTFTSNRNNTVRYCLSVNDNKLVNLSSLVNLDDNEAGVAMDNFKFYNNTIINCAPTLFGILQNSTIANNIFVGGDKVVSITLPLGFNNTIDHNCFYNMNSTYKSKNNFKCDPGFIGNDETDKNSYKLSAESPLIGKGIKVDDDMGEFDFYGNKLTDVHNIGCYDGQGEAEPSVKTVRTGGNRLKNLYEILSFIVPKIPGILSDMAS